MSNQKQCEKSPAGNTATSGGGDNSRVEELNNMMSSATIKAESTATTSTGELSGKGADVIITTRSIGKGLAAMIGDDISRVMCKRAINGYGMEAKDMVGSNSAALEGTGAKEGVSSLHNVWQWLGKARVVTSAGNYRLKAGQQYSYHGIHAIVSQSSTTGRSDTLNKAWIDFGSSSSGKQPHTSRVFRSEARTLCLQLVSWLPLGTAYNCTQVGDVRPRRKPLSIKFKLNN